MPRQRRPIAVAFSRPWSKPATHPGGDDSSSSCTRPEDSFTLMTYNVLNDSCIDDACYAYCDEDIRYMVARCEHIKEELKVYGPDIACMQEVNQDQYVTLFLPMMRELGYDCVASGRDPHQTKHIDAIFYKRDLFELKRSKAVTFYDAILEELKDLSLDYLTVAAIQKHVMTSHQVVLAQLSHKLLGKDIFIANTHIYWGNLHVPDVQALQVCVATRCLQKFTEGVVNPSYVLTGDFNTPPGWPAYQMLTDTEGPSEKSVQFLRQIQVHRDDGKTCSLVETIRELLKVSLKLKSSYKHVVGEEPSITSCDFDYGTNKTRTYTLDYIWFGPDSLDVTEVLETPPDDVITQEKGLPSTLFPSDHIPLMGKFVFK